MPLAAPVTRATRPNELRSDAGNVDILVPFKQAFADASATAEVYPKVEGKLITPRGASTQFALGEKIPLRRVQKAATGCGRRGGVRPPAALLLTTRTRMSQ